MGSLEEEMLVQMVHDFIESDAQQTPTSILASSEAISLHRGYTCLLLEGILGSSTEVEMEILGRALKYVKEMGVDTNEGSVKKRLMMRLRMDGFDASLCRSSWVATMDSPGGDYEYIAIATEEQQEEGHDGSTYNRVIVDTDFRSQFELARPTSGYTKIYSMLPSIFVGNEEKLKRMVSLLCSAAQKSLKESGLHIPPWRKSSYVQSKWLPSSHKASTIPLSLPPQKEVWVQGTSRVWSL